MLVDYTHAAVVAGERPRRGRAGRGRRRRLERARRVRLRADRRARPRARGRGRRRRQLLAERGAGAPLRRRGGPHLERWEIVDCASATKPDAPSGTAREIAERLARCGRRLVGVPLGTVLGAPRGARRDDRGNAGALGAAAELRRLDARSSSPADGRAADAPPRRGRQPRRRTSRDAPRDPRRPRARRPDTRARPAASRLGRRRPSGPRSRRAATRLSAPSPATTRSASHSVVGDERAECRERRGARLADREPGGPELADRVRDLGVGHGDGAVDAVAQRRPGSGGDLGAVEARHRSCPASGRSPAPRPRARRSGMRP